MRGGKRQGKAVNEAKGNPGGRKPGKSRAKPAVEKIDAEIGRASCRERV